MKQNTDPHRWAVIDNVIISYTIPGPIPDEAWNGFLESIETHRPQYCLVLCTGAVHVDAGQRGRSAATVARTGSHVLVVTDNRVTRALAIAVSWFGAQLDAFAWRDVGRALDSLVIASGTRQRLEQAALNFHADHGHLDL
jgi:hypothetical protein